MDALIRAAEESSFAEVDAARDLLDAVSKSPADMAARTISTWARSRHHEKDAEQRQQRRWQARRLSIWQDDDGMTVIHGLVDPVTGAQIKSAVDTETDRLWRLDGGRDGADETRSAEQRRADAATNLLTGAGPGRTVAADATHAREDTRADSAAEGAADTDTARPHPRTQVVVIVDADVITGKTPTAAVRSPASERSPRPTSTDSLASPPFSG